MKFTPKKSYDGSENEVEMTITPQEATPRQDGALERGKANGKTIASSERLLKEKHMKMCSPFIIFYKDGNGKEWHREESFEFVKKQIINRIENYIRQKQYGFDVYLPFLDQMKKESVFIDLKEFRGLIIQETLKRVFEEIGNILINNGIDDSIDFDKTQFRTDWIELKKRFRVE